jgi:hypothetical protein
MFLENVKYRDDMGGLGLDWEDDIEMEPKTQNGRVAFDPAASAQGLVACCCEHCVQLAGCMKQAVY